MTLPAYLEAPIAQYKLEKAREISAGLRRADVESTEARQGLLKFTEFTFPQYRPEPAHRLIAETLDRVVSGDIQRLMIFAPPQHGKSELVSVRLPAYWLGKHPNDPIILASYGADLAYDKSRQARSIVESAEYGQVFPGIKTRSDSRAVNHWELAAPYRGGMLAAGVGGPVTGHGAKLGIIDDPFANWEEAQSALIRNTAWNWWRGTFRTRVWEGGAIVLIMTRWHESDLAGRILQEQGDKWMVLRLPALAETQEERDVNNGRMGLPVGEPDPLGRGPGEPLSPGRYSRLALEELRSDVGSMVWGAEYQATPHAPEGNRFKRWWFEIVGAAPRKAKRGRYWDKAGTKDGGKRTAGVLMALGDDGIVTIEDVVTVQESALEREKLIKATAERDREHYGDVKIWVEQEPGSGGKESAEATIRNLHGFSVYADQPTGDKDTRLEPFAAQAEAGNVKLVRGLWNERWLDEMCAIPNGTFRDQADATSGVYNKLTGRKSSGRRIGVRGYGER